MSQEVRARGASASAKWRNSLMENDPERYELIRQRQRERERKRREGLEEYWATGTRASEQEKEAYLAKRREICRRSRQAKRTETSVPILKRNFQGMTPEEKKEHINARRREVYNAKSKQKKVADNKKHAAKMRDFRQAKKYALLAEKKSFTSTNLSCGQTVPNATSIPKIADVPLPQAVTATQPKQDRVKSALRNVSDKEAAALKLNLFLRRTSEHLDVKSDPQRKSNSSRSHESTAKLVAKTAKLWRSRYHLVKREVQKFYLRPDVSSVLPHGRFATKHRPGYVMLMTIDAAHQVFSDTGKTVSRALFASLRPRNVRKLGTIATETCLCINCTNMKLKIDALNRKLKTNSIPPETELMNFILCPYAGRWPKMDCVEGRCTACKDFLRPFTVIAREIFYDDITWLHWERRPTGDGQTSLKLDVFQYDGTVNELLSQMSGDLHEPVKGTSFIKHLFNAYWQQYQYVMCKDSLQQGQLLMVQDFVKNRTESYTNEVKSAFCGNQQISLHPSVCFYKNEDGQMVRHVIMFFWDDIKHDDHHVHTVTKQAVAIVKASSPLTQVIIWSDGAASQYKERKTFADLCLYPLHTERHFFGSEHGKGESDGETWRFSQALKRASAGGANFRHVQDLVDFASAWYKQDPLKKYSFVHIPLDTIRRNCPETDVPTIPGMRGFHQFVQSKKNFLAARNHSCFCSGCRARGGTGCINKAHVKPLNMLKMTPSISLDDSFIEEQTEQKVWPIVAKYTNTDCPSVGQWLELIGQVLINKKKEIFEERTFKAVVIARPDGGCEDFFYVNFLKKTPAGSYLLSPRDISHIRPDTPKRYKWKVVPAPIVNYRNHHFFQ